MQTAYIYSASRANALAQSLLTKTDIERLLVAAPGMDLHEALKETYLAPYITHVPDGSVPLAIEQTLIDAKKLIHRMAPHGDMFRVLWVQYDVHNLRAFAKAAARKLDYDALVSVVSRRGIYEPDYLYKHAVAGTLNELQPEWQAAYNEGVRLAEAGEIDKVDAVFDTLFFMMANRIAKKAKDAFITTYLKAIIDLYNIKGRLRSLTHPTVFPAPAFVAGGTVKQASLETMEQVLAALATLGGAAHWADAVTYVSETGNTTRIDARVDEYLTIIAKAASMDMFSSASLVLYYLKCRESAANIRTIVVGKNSGMSEADIRANLRLAYVNP